MSNNSPYFFPSKSPDFTPYSKDHTPTSGEDFKGCEAEKKREVIEGREAEKRSEAIKGNEMKEGYKMKEGSEAEINSNAKEGCEIEEGCKIEEGSNALKKGAKISLSQAKNPDQPKHITPLHKGRGEPREARRGGGALLSTTYFGPVQWYQKLNRHRCIIEQHDNFVKQTYRNRCVIASANGPQTLTVPIERYDGMKCAMRDIRISDHGNWRHLHWQALVSAYGETPFFEYYADDIRPFFEERRWKYLLDFNLDITHTLCSLLDVRPDLTLSDHYIDADETISGSGSLNATAAGFGGAVKGLDGAAEGLGSSSACSLFVDYRDAIRPKHPLPDAEFEARPYYQVRAQRHGFLPNLSVLDLLFNEGPEGIFYL